VKRGAPRRFAARGLAIAAVMSVLAGAHSRQPASSVSTQASSRFKVVHAGSSCRVAADGLRVRFTIIVRNVGSIAASPPVRLSIRNGRGAVERARTPVSPVPAIAGRGIRTIRIVLTRKRSDQSKLNACLVELRGDKGDKRYSIAVRPGATA
jgi:hypothetical protein